MRRAPSGALGLLKHKDLFMSRFARSWLLIKASMDVLRNDNALLVLPAISGVMTMLVAGGFVALAVSDGTFAAMAAAGRHHYAPPAFYAWLFCMSSSSSSTPRWSARRLFCSAAANRRFGMG
jgi:hypothetical protein